MKRYVDEDTYKLDRMMIPVSFHIALSLALSLRLPLLSLLSDILYTLSDFVSTYHDIRHRHTF